MISFEAIFEQSSPRSPVVFILSPGCDPISDLMKLAERTGFGGDRLKFLAMGQGQEKVTSVGGLGRSVGTQCVNCTSSFYSHGLVQISFLNAIENEVNLCFGNRIQFANLEIMRFCNVREAIWLLGCFYGFYVQSDIFSC